MKRVIFPGVASLSAVLVATTPSATPPSDGSDTQRLARAGEPSREGRHPRLVLAVLIVAVVLAAAGVFTYVVTRPPDLVSLKVTDGSTVGAISGNLTGIFSNAPLVLDFAATTYANETDGAPSTLTLRLHTWAFFNSGCGCVEVDVNATVEGAFASNLRPEHLRLSANQTGPNGSLQSVWDVQYGYNVSFDPGQSFGFYNGSGELTATIAGGASRFGYSDRFEVNGRPQYNRFVGFRATVAGALSPAVSVGILLKIINVPGGVWV